MDPFTTSIGLSTIITSLIVLFAIFGYIQGYKGCSTIEGLCN